MKSEDFETETALLAVTALKIALERRTHRRKYLGEVYQLPSTLGDVVNLPRITALLKSRSLSRREQGLEEFTYLWSTLSAATRELVLKEVGWYDHQDLDWDDKRSNRKPDHKTKE